MKELQYRTEIGLSSTGSFLVERFCENTMVDRYTTTDLREPRKRFVTWMFPIIKMAMEPLGQVPSPEVPVIPPRALTVLERLEVAEREVANRATSELQYATRCADLEHQLTAARLSASTPGKEEPAKE